MTLTVQTCDAGAYGKASVPNPVYGAFRAYYQAALAAVSGGGGGVPVCRGGCSCLQLRAWAVHSCSCQAVAALLSLLVLRLLLL